MSRTTLYAIAPDGDIVHHADFPNAWRGAMLVWTDMAVRYGVVPPGEGHRILLDPGLMKEVWALGGDPRVPEHERIVMLSTFDRALCETADFPALARALRRFDAELEARGVGNSSLGEQAGAIQELPAKVPGVLGCGWRQTSVSEDLWQVRMGEGDFEPYNVHREYEHFWIFDELEPEDEEQMP